MKKDNLSPSNIANRLASETPTYWKKVRNLMITIGAVGGVIVGLPIALPAVVLTIAGYAVAIGAVGGVLAQTAKK